VRSFVLAVFLATTASAQTPSVETARAASAPKESPIGDVVLTDGDRQLHGKLFLTASSLRFCCHSFTDDPTAKAVAKCPYSFTLAAAEVKEQYLTTESENEKWHLVTKTDRHYEFDAPSKVTAKAFDSVKNSFPEILSKTVKSLGKSVVDGWKAPAVAKGDPCTDH
jgi:hypothetical protein